MFDRQETLSRVLESTTAFVRFRYKAFLKLHFTIRNKVPDNKPLTNLACSGRTGEYWPSVVAVRTSLRSVRTATTSGQYSPVRPSRSVSKRLLKVNDEKTETLVLGDNILQETHFPKHNLCEVIKKILGIYFGHNVRQKDNLNFREALKSIKRSVSLWKWRGLSLLGRIQIVKTFVIPKFVQSICYTNF